MAGFAERPDRLGQKREECSSPVQRPGHSWERQRERYFGAGGLRAGSLDLGFIEDIECVSLEHGRSVDNAAAIAKRALGPGQQLDLLCAAACQLTTMDLTTREGCAFYRTRVSQSTFSFFLIEAAPLVMDVSYRTPLAAPNSRVRLLCNHALVAELDSSLTWRRERLQLAAAATRSGPNILVIEWPHSELDASQILSDYADALERCESPVAPYPVTGELWRFVARRVALRDESPPEKCSEHDGRSVAGVLGMTHAAKELVREFQAGLLAAIREYFAFEGLSLSQQIADCIFTVPRHEFVQRYRMRSSRQRAIILGQRRLVSGGRRQPGNAPACTLSRRRARLVAEGAVGKKKAGMMWHASSTESVLVWYRARFTGRDRDFDDAPTPERLVAARS